jgi:hypothetical protein
MNFILTNQDIINHLNTIEKNEHNNFINSLLTLGYKEYNKSNQTILCKNNALLDNNLIELENKLENKFDNLKLLINELKIEQQNNLLLLNKNTNKGNLGENIVYEFFIQNNYQIEDTSEIAHAGDLKLFLPDINQHVLIEIKNYKNTVDQKQIDKFYYDIEYTGIKLGIFISLTSKIVNIKYPIEWKITNNNEILIFISECSIDHLYLAIFCLISLYKSNNKSDNNYINYKNEELFNDIKYLSLQKENVNKLKNEIIQIHSSYSNSILTLYNNLCIFDNNFNYIVNKIYNKLDNIIKIGAKDNDLYLQLDKLQTNNKDILELIISDLNNDYKLEIIENKKIIIKSNDLYKGEIKILKTTINLVLDSGLEIKNINKENWIKIINLI